MLSGNAWRDGVRARQPVDEVVGRPGSGELHLAVFQQLARGDELVLIPLHALRFDEVRDVQQHLAVIHGATGDLFILGREKALHLNRDGTTFGLALALTGSSFPQVGEIFLADIVLRGDGAKRLLEAAVLDHDLEMHLGFAAQAFHVRRVLALIGADGAAERFIIGEDSTEAEGKYGRELETVADDTGMVPGGLLIEIFLWIVFRNDDCEITGWIEEDLIP